MHESESLETKQTARRPTQYFDPALDAPIVLTLDQLEKIAAGFTGSDGGRTALNGAMRALLAAGMPRARSPS
jgi:hypothetical protein